MNRPDHRPYSLLVADSQRKSLATIADRLASVGYKCLEAPDGFAAWNRFARNKPDLVLAAHDLRGIDGFELLARLRSVSTIPFIMHVRSPDLQVAISATQAGADDVVHLPDELGKLATRVRSALESHFSHDADALVRSRLPGRSAPIEQLRDQLAAVAGLNVPVLFSGERGTGRSYLARCLAESDDSPLFVVNHQSSESFSSRVGIQTVYLNEIDQFSRADQARWLGRLQEGSERPSSRPKRILASTTADLDLLARDGSFNPALANFLARFTLRVPPLRHRPEDIPILTRALGSHAAKRMGRKRVVFTDAALRILKRQPWPGNIAELESVVARLVAFSAGGVVTKASVSRVFLTHEEGLGLARRAAAMRQRDELVNNINEAGGNLAEVARRMGMSRGAVIYRAKKFGLIRTRK